MQAASAQIVWILSQLVPDDMPNEDQVAHVRSVSARKDREPHKAPHRVVPIAGVLVPGCRAPHDYFFRFALKSLGVSV